MVENENYKSYTANNGTELPLSQGERGSDDSRAERLLPELYQCSGTNPD